MLLTVERNSRYLETGFWHSSLCHSSDHQIWHQCLQLWVIQVTSNWLFTTLLSPDFAWFCLHSSIIRAPATSHTMGKTKRHITIMITKKKKRVALLSDTLFPYIIWAAATTSACSYVLVTVFITHFIILLSDCNVMKHSLVSISHSMIYRFPPLYDHNMILKTWLYSELKFQKDLI